MMLTTQAEAMQYITDKVFEILEMLPNMDAKAFGASVFICAGYKIMQAADGHAAAFAYMEELLRQERARALQPAAPETPQ